MLSIIIFYRAGACRCFLAAFDCVQLSTQILLNESGVSDTLDTHIEHRHNVVCVLLIYKYIQSDASIDIKEVRPSMKSFSGTTRPGDALFLELAD